MIRSAFIIIICISMIVQSVTRYFSIFFIDTNCVQPTLIPSCYDNKNIIFQLIYLDNIVKIAELLRTQKDQTLKFITQFHTYIDITEKTEVLLTHQMSESTKHESFMLASWKNIDSASYSEKLLMYDSWNIMKYLMRIKIISKNKFIPHSLQIKYSLEAQNKNNKDLKFLEDSISSYFHLVYKKHDKDKFENQDISILCTVYTSKCVEALAGFHGIKNNYILISYSDHIFDFNFLKGTIIENEYKLKIYLSHQKNEFKQSSEIQPVDNKNTLASSQNPAYRHQMCMNGGSVTHKFESSFKIFYCLCPKEYLGYNCRVKSECINCASNVCEKYSVCNKCIPGFGGKHCTEPVCEGMTICKNGGKCRIENNKRICVCPFLYHGKYCESMYSLSPQKLITTSRAFTVIFMLFSIGVFALAVDYKTLLSIVKKKEI